MICVSAAPSTTMPEPPFDRRPVPSGVVPMTLPTIWSPSPVITIALPGKFSSARPRTVDDPASRTMPPSPDPSISIPSSTIPGPTKTPGSLVPSIVIGTAACGSGDKSEIVGAPSLRIANLIVAATSRLSAAFSASRSEQSATVQSESLWSSAVLTVYVGPACAGSADVQVSV